MTSPAEPAHTPAPPTATLAAWLEQQVAADEALATAATAGPWEQIQHALYGPQSAVHMPTGDLLMSEPVGDGYVGAPNAAHIAAQDPAQTLRRVAAIRQVLALHPFKFEEGDGRLIGDLWTCQTCGWDVHYPCPTLRALASQYADRDGYQEWA